MLLQNIFHSTDSYVHDPPVNFTRRIVFLYNRVIGGLIEESIIQSGGVKDEIGSVVRGFWKKAVAVVE